MLTIGLTAKNSNGVQRLFFDKSDEGEYYFTLTGEYKGQQIQIDFEELTGEDVEDLIYLIRARKPKEETCLISKP